MFRSAITGKGGELYEKPVYEDFLAGGKAGLRNPTEEQSQKEYESALKLWEDTVKSGYWEFYDSNFFATKIAQKYFAEGKPFDFDEAQGDVFGYWLDPSHFSSPDDMYDFVANTIKVMKEKGVGGEYIRDMTLPKKEDIWGSDKKLQFDEVIFTLQDTSGNVLSSVSRTPKVADFQ